MLKKKEEEEENPEDSPLLLGLLTSAVLQPLCIQMALRACRNGDLGVLLFREWWDRKPIFNKNLDHSEAGAREKFFGNF